MKQKNLVLMVVAVGCGLVAAFLTTQINAKPKIDTVEVIVAAKELPTGTLITKDNWEKLTIRKSLPKEGLTQQAVTDPAELLEKRLARSVRKDEPFNSADLKKGSVIVFLEGKDIISLSMSASNAAAGAVGPGSKVDVLATLKLGNVTEAFPLLVDMHVLEVNGEADLVKNPRFPNMSTVSFAVTQEEALLITLAKQRGCHLELLLRHPGKPLDPNYNLQKVKALLQNDKNPATLYVSDGGEGKTGQPRPEAPVTPTETAPDKPTTVKVLVATEYIPANTEITKDLIETKFQERQLQKEHAEGAHGDLTPLLGKALRSGLGKGQWVTDELVGLQTPKPSPRDFFELPKPDSKTDPKAEPARPGARRNHDVAVHTASGTYVHRFEEETPGGAWKLKQVMSPEEAARKPGAPAPAPEKKSTDSSDRKLD